MKYSFLFLGAFCVSACGAASADDAADNEVDELVRRPKIALSSASEDSVPARLRALLDGNERTANLGVSRARDGALTIQGTDDRVRRAVTCAQTPGSHATTCTFSGFEPAGSGGTLPQTFTALGPNAPLTVRLVELLRLGSRDAKLGIRATVTAGRAEAPSSESYELSDGQSSLSCRESTGGVVGLPQADCRIVKSDFPFPAAK